MWLVPGWELALTQSEVQRAAQSGEHHPVVMTLSSDHVLTCLAMGRAHLGTPERALWSQAQPQLVPAVENPPGPSPVYFHCC